MSHVYTHPIECCCGHVGYDRRCVCGRWVPWPTRAQGMYVVMLAYVLGVPAPPSYSPAEAARQIDELLVLCELDPDIRRCAAPGCDRFVNRTRKVAHTYCKRHREAR